MSDSEAPYGSPTQSLKASHIVPPVFIIAICSYLIGQVVLEMVVDTYDMSSSSSNFHQSFYCRLLDTLIPINNFNISTLIFGSLMRVFIPLLILCYLLLYHIVMKKNSVPLPEKEAKLKAFQRAAAVSETDTGTNSGMSSIRQRIMKSTYSHNVSTVELSEPSDGFQLFTSSKLIRYDVFSLIILVFVCCPMFVWNVWETYKFCRMGDSYIGAFTVDKLQKIFYDAHCVILGALISVIGIQTMGLQKKIENVCD